MSTKTSALTRWRVISTCRRNVGVGVVQLPARATWRVGTWGRGLWGREARRLIQQGTKSVKERDCLGVGYSAGNVGARRIAASAL